VRAGTYRLEIHEALPSTSEAVARRAEAGEAAGLALLARRQTAGRGTQGRAWESPPGNLYLTVLLRPGGKLREAPQWSLLAAVALADAVAPLLPDPTVLALKWPNDLLLRGRKAAGILTQSAADPDGRLDWLSFGFGVNLAAAPEVPGRATACLSDEGAEPPAPEAFADGSLHALAAGEVMS
jgi:BirA family biotin operon repressor/biotin-[acetyl-CoA-carboxylase] ligase